MAKFLNTTGVSYHLEELIKSTTDRLILISPYLQFHNRVRDHISNLNIQKIDIRIVFRESKLQLEESNWIESQIGVRTSICSTLHAKCYLNENEAIVTSMNLYSFSQQNNDEMGILVTKKDDPELYHDIENEAKRLLTISEEIRVSVKKVGKEPDAQTKKVTKVADTSNLSFKSTSALSKILEISSKDLFKFFADKGWLKREGKSWILTEKGEAQGGAMKKGQYGPFAAWPETILSKIEDEIDRLLVD
jgi:phosphatidylserine/phosphatidylglycerophosphate/cardiolipin synthase-like enzyme